MGFDLTDVAAAAGPNEAGSGTHVATFVVLGVAVLAVLATIAIVVSPRRRRLAARLVGVPVGGLLALYLVGRGIAEFWMVDYSDPASYQHAWGGPSLAGVFAVHSGPGLAVIIAALIWLSRRHRRPHTATNNVGATPKPSHARAEDRRHARAAPP